MKHIHSADDFTDKSLCRNDAGTDDEFAGVIPLEELEITLQPACIPNQPSTEFDDMTGIDCW